MITLNEDGDSKKDEDEGELKDTSSATKIGSRTSAVQDEAAKLDAHQHQAQQEKVDRLPRVEQVIPPLRSDQSSYYYPPQFNHSHVPYFQHQTNNQADQYNFSPNIYQQYPPSNHSASFNYHQNPGFFEHYQHLLRQQNNYQAVPPPPIINEECSQKQDNSDFTQTFTIL